MPFANGEHTFTSQAVRCMRKASDISTTTPRPLRGENKWRATALDRDQFGDGCHLESGVANAERYSSEAFQLIRGRSGLGVSTQQRLLGDRREHPRGMSALQEIIMGRNRTT